MILSSCRPANNSVYNFEFFFAGVYELLHAVGVDERLNAVDLHQVWAAAQMLQALKWGKKLECRLKIHLNNHSSVSKIVLC